MSKTEETDQVEDKDLDIERVTPPSEPPPVKIDLDAADDDERDDDDEEEGEPALKANGQPRDGKTGKWTEKKRERNRERGQQRGRLFQENERLRTEAENYRRQLDETKREYDRRFAELDVRMRNQQTPPADPIDAELKSLSDQMDAELKLIENDQNRPYTRYRELQRKEMSLVAQQAAQKADAQRRQNERPAAADPYASRRPFIESEFPWVMSNTAAARAARAYKEMLIHVEGRPDTIATDREALAHVQAKMGLGETAARPGQADRERYFTPPAARGAAPGGRRPRSIEVPRVLVEGSGLSTAQLAEALRDD